MSSLTKVVPRALAVMVAAAGLVACSGLRSSNPVTQVYPLQPRFATPPAGGSAAPLAATLGVQLPLAVPGLANNSIALLRPDGALDAYAASRWPGELPEELQPLIVQALRSAGHWANVQAEAGPFKSDYLLQVEIQQFTAVYAGDVHDSAPMVQVRLVATLGRRADRAVLKSYAIEESAPAGANRMGAVIAAFNRAAGAALQRLAADAVPPP